MSTKSFVPNPSNATPLSPGTAASGTSMDVSRADHVHPAQTIPSVPNASNAVPQALGVAASGVSADYSRADHIHALPTIPGPSGSTPLVASGAGAVGTGTTYARNDHVHPAQSIAAFAVGTPNSRSVSLATAYQATDNTKPAFVVANLTSTATLSLSGGTTNTADIVIGSTNAVASGTGTTIGKYANTNTGALTIGLNLSTVSAVGYSFALPAGWYFAVRQTAGTVTVTSAFDQSLG